MTNLSATPLTSTRKTSSPPASLLSPVGASLPATIASPSSSTAPTPPPKSPTCSASTTFVSFPSRVGSAHHVEDNDSQTPLLSPLLPRFFRPHLPRRRPTQHPPHPRRRPRLF